MPTRVKQGLVAALGVAMAVVMLWLGLWQMRVFESKEAGTAQARAALPPVSLVDLVGADGSILGDVYGRSVTVEGRFLPDQEVLVVPERGDSRVVTAFVVADGRVLPVVRGLADGAPPAPFGELTISGVFLPSEAGADSGSAETELGSVRVPLLAQEWQQQLFPGFVTLAAPQAQAQGLTPAEVVLPSGEGSVQNYGYALQWWVFAAFAVFMTYRFVRAIGRSGTVTMQEDA